MTILRVTIFVPYCQRLEDNSHLELCFTYLRNQTQKVHQIIVMDDSEEKDRPDIKRLCKRYKADYLEFPYVDHAPAFSRKFNKGFEIATGDALVILCANWCLGKDWIEKMTDMMVRRGNHCILVCDNARQAMGEAGSDPGDKTRPLYDWYQRYPDKRWDRRSDGSWIIPDEFREGNFMLVDTGFLMMVHRDYWLPWDETADPPADDPSQWPEKGAWHAVSEWGYRMLVSSGRDMEMWVKRSLDANHLEMPARTDTRWVRQTEVATQWLRSKGVP